MNLIKKIILWLFPDILEIDHTTNVEEETEYIERNTTTICYKKRAYMTKNEIVFYQKLKKIEEISELYMFPQVNLSVIINKISNQKYHNELFRNVDFGIFDKKFTPLLLIELNDSSHEQINRKDRDLKVQKICDDANIPIMKFYTKYPNEESYIKKRIQKELGEYFKPEINSTIQNDLIR